MTPEERAQRMLERLPLVLQSGPNLRRLFVAIAGELETMEAGARLLLESRWYTLARDWEKDPEPVTSAPAGTNLTYRANTDLGAIGALVNLQPGLGESAAYFRQRLTGVLRLHTRGITTASAILQLVSFVYQAEQPPEVEVKDGIAVGRFRVENEGNVREIAVELIDNPSSPGFASFLGATVEHEIVTCNRGLEQAFPSIEIKATHGPVSMPRLRHVESGLDVILLDTIEQGKTLTLRHEHPALIDGNPIKGVVVIANPTRFATKGQTDPLPFLFDTSEARFSLCEPSNRLPHLPLGETHWRYSAMSKGEIEGYMRDKPELLELVKDVPADPPGPPIDITFRWTEVTPATFELRIPAGFVPPRYQSLDPKEGQTAFFRDIRAALEYGRAAGVQATIGIMLSLPTETVSLKEKPMAMALDVPFAEAQTMSDRLGQLGPSIELDERLPPAAERFSFDGIFDITRFEGSRFQ